MSLTYTTYRTQLQTLIASQDPDPDFDIIFPAAIDYAEQRIYRELDLLNTVQTDTSTVLTASNRNASISNTFVVVNGVNVLTPAGSAADTGTRIPLVPVSRDVVDTIWPGNSTVGAPQVFAMLTQWSMIVGPSPDAAYRLEVVGTYRPAPLSVSNTTTFLTQYLPDLFLAASMVFMSGYMRNFGTQASDPQMGQSWEQQYGKLFESANNEELRKQFWSSSWSSLPNSSQAQPTRG